MGALTSSFADPQMHLRRLNPPTLETLGEFPYHAPPSCCGLISNPPSESLKKQSPLQTLKSLKRGFQLIPPTVGTGQKDLGTELEQNHAGRQTLSSGIQKEGNRVGPLKKLGRRPLFIHSKASYGPDPVWGPKTGEVIRREGIRGFGGQVWMASAWLTNTWAPEGCRSTRLGQETKGLQFSPVGVPDVTPLCLGNPDCGQGRQGKRHPPTSPRPQHCAQSNQCTHPGSWGEQELLRLGRLETVVGRLLRPGEAGRMYSQLLGTPWPLNAPSVNPPTHSRVPSTHVESFYITHTLGKVCPNHSDEGINSPLRAGPW